MTPTDAAAIDDRPSVPSEKPAGWRRHLSFDNRFLPPILVTAILLVGQLGFGILESYSRTALAIVAAMATELLLSRLLLGKWPHLASAYITGISVGILIRSPAFWPYALCSMISITSKYAIRWKDRHIWNPSNLGVSAMLFLAPATVASLSVQWGNAFWPMLAIWAFGSAVIWRLRRFHICAAYVAAFFAFSFVRSALTGEPWLAEVAPITGPMYQLYVFFMITDPKTTVRSKRGQIIVAVLIAFVEMLLRLNRVVHAPYYALFFVGPAAYMLEIWWTSRQAAKADARGEQPEPDLTGKKETDSRPVSHSM